MALYLKGDRCRDPFEQEVGEEMAAVAGLTKPKHKPF